MATISSTVTRQTARWDMPVIVAYNALTGIYKTGTATVTRRTISTPTAAYLVVVWNVGAVV